jgi:hypothetical protein
VTVLRSGYGSCFAVSIVPVCNESFKTADTNGLTLDTANALGLTLCFLGANTAANCGKAGGLVNYLVCALEVALFDSIDEFGNMYIYRATCYARHMLAGEATKRLVDCHFFCITCCYLKEVSRANVGILMRHRILFKTHIRFGCHLILPPS